MVAEEFLEVLQQTVVGKRCYLGVTQTVFLRIELYTLETDRRRIFVLLSLLHFLRCEDHVTERMANRDG